MSDKRGAEMCRKWVIFGGLGGKRGVRMTYLGLRKPEKRRFLCTGGLDDWRRGIFGPDSDIMS